VQRFVYASSLSVYHKCHMRDEYPLDENAPPDSWDTYGFSKRLGETIGAAWVEQYPQATFIGLRMYRPLNEAAWPGTSPRPDWAWQPIGPNDVRRLFLAAVAFNQAGHYVMQVSGDREGANFPNTRATEILGWKPEGN
jgi:hypothetical protein